ncbi:MAG: glycosyl transferase [Methylotenera sp.]|nr:glycosyl transferase [Methylotenera sp.]
MLNPNNRLSKVILGTTLAVLIVVAIYFRPTQQQLNVTPIDLFWVDYLLTILITFSGAAIASWFICYLIIRYEHVHAHFSHDHTDAGPQKFHTSPTPRIGGLAIFGGLLVASGIEQVIHPEAAKAVDDFGLLLVATAPAFVGGLIEDVTKNVGVAQRLLLTMISAAIGAWLLGAIIHHINIPMLDQLMSWAPLAIVFTVFAIGGVANAINIIDGYNGLASGFSIFALISLAFVAAQVGDNFIFVASVGMAGAMLGFLVCNWPKGKIFMGDAGAYLLGFVLAELSVLLISRNPTVSPWYPLLLLGYPVFETLFSMYRRKFVHKSTVGEPDAQHFHQLLFKWVVRNNIRAGQPFLTTENNSRVAPYIWLPAILGSTYGALFWQSTMMLVLGFVLGCTLYVILYWRLAKLKYIDRRATPRD